MKVKLIKVTSIVFALFLMFSFAGCSDNNEQKESGDQTINNDGSSEQSKEQNNSDNKTIQISDLKIGDRVMDESWNWEYRTEYAYVARDDDITAPVVWVVVAKDHYGSSGITLITENLVGYFPFDTSSLENGLLAGRNHWGESGTGNAQHGLRPWLNSNGIHEGEGFYSAFSDNFKSLIIETEIPNKEYEKGTAYTTTDKVFIPSSTELGDTEHFDTYEIGKVYSYFEGSDDEFRAAMIKGDDWGERNYWLRNPNTKGYRPVGSVYEAGFFTNDFADFNSVGVRPTVNISKNAKVSAVPDENGIYIFKY